MPSRLISSLFIAFICSGNLINGAQISGNKRRRVPTQVMTEYLNDAPSTKRSTGLLQASFAPVKPSPTGVSEVFGDNPSPVLEFKTETAVPIITSSSSSSPIISSSSAEIAAPRDEVESESESEIDEERLVLPIRIVRLDEEVMQTMVEALKAKNHIDLSLIFMVRNISFDTFVEYNGSIKTLQYHLINLLRADNQESQAKEDDEEASLANDFITNPDDEFIFDFSNDNYLN